MAGTQWKKSPPELIGLFEDVFPEPPAEARTMFGYPAGFVNGNMFMGLHEERMVLRLQEDQRSKLLEVEGAELFEPMPGRPMREYVVVPPSVLASKATLRRWVARALEYGASLPPKTKGKAVRKAGGAGKRA